MSPSLKTQRVDLAGNVYMTDNLKLETRANSGTGTRHAKLPVNRKNLLRNDDNKDELFQFLGQERVFKNTGHPIIVYTLLDSVVSSKDGKNTDGLQTCSHEEADTPKLLHIKYTMNSGFKSVMIRTVNTDVVVLDVAHFQCLPNVEQLWIAFGTDKDSDTSQSMILPLHYVLRWPHDCCYFMHSPAAT